MPSTTLEGAIPAELVTQSPDTPTNQPPQQPQIVNPDGTTPACPYMSDQELAGYVVNWRNQLHTARLDKFNIWNECWQLYRGVEDFSDKEDWQAKIVTPKAFSSVKQAVNVIKRLLSTAKEPWQLDAVNPDDIITTLRGQQMTDLTEFFLDQADWLREFSEGLECGFITGVGVWKLWWGFKPRNITSAEVVAGPNGRPIRQLVRRTINEGRLFMRAVDPYNFYWLPGSKLNKWVGTIEDIQIARWELLDLANKGVFDLAKVKNIKPLRIPETKQQNMLRFSERPTTANGPNEDTGMVKLTEYYGPVVKDGQIFYDMAHIVVGNDNAVLKCQPISTWKRTPPYVGFSPLSLPFRTDGVGLIEMVREINRALSRLANLSIDTLVYRLLPVFEITPGVYENEEDFETGLTPGKMFRRNLSALGQPGIVPVQFEDVSNGAIAVQAALDRSHQEGSLISEIQQGIPQYRGAQTATEVDTKQANQDSFFGNMAVDIEREAIGPIVEMASDLIMQFIDTATDPRVASILGVDGQMLAGMSRDELMEMVSGDYKVKVSGITDQLKKAEMLQNLVQFMNLIGQNAEAWMPYVNQSELLKKVLEGFRPMIHDLDNIITDPETAAAKQAAMQQAELAPQAMGMIPQLIELAHNAENAAAEAQQQQAVLEQKQQQMKAEFQQYQGQLQLQMKELEIAKLEAEAASKMAKADEKLANAAKRPAGDKD